MSSETYLDFNDPQVADDPAFCGVVWMPTSYLRWYVPVTSGGIQHFPVLEQVWQTQVIGGPLSAANSRPVNPGLSEWRPIQTLQVQVEDPPEAS